MLTYLIWVVCNFFFFFVLMAAYKQHGVHAATYCLGCVFFSFSLLLKALYASSVGPANQAKLQLILTWRHNIDKHSFRANDICGFRLFSILENSFENRVNCASC